MRILYLNPIGATGGAEKSLLDIFEVLRVALPDWELGLITGSSGNLIGAAEALGVRVKVLPMPHGIAGLGDAGLTSTYSVIKKSFRASVGLIPYILRLRKAVCEFQPDVIHSNGFKMHVLGAWAGPRGIPLIWHIRDYVTGRPIMRHLLRAHAGWCSVAIANSQSVGRDVARACGTQLSVRCIYNAVDLTKYCPEGPVTNLAELAQMPLPEPGTMTIGLLATMAKWKGHKVFLKALAELPPEVSWRAYVIGGSVYHTENSQYSIGELRELATELRIADKAGFTGFVSDPASAIRALDVVVHASTEPEPFGRVIAEAMACGKPVVTSGTGGAQELIAEGRDAMVHPPGDHLKLAACLMRLVCEPELRAALGEAGKLTAATRFERGRLATELLEVYREVAADCQVPNARERLAHAGGSVAERAPERLNTMPGPIPRQ